MKEYNFDVKLALTAFNNILSNGRKDNREYHYQGLTASSDFDGYTLFIKNQNVSLTIFFHNKYKIDFKHKLALNEFYEQLEKIAKKRA